MTSQVALQIGHGNVVAPSGIPCNPSDPPSQYESGFIYSSENVVTSNFCHLAPNPCTNQSAFACRPRLLAVPCMSTRDGTRRFGLTPSNAGLKRRGYGLGILSSVTLRKMPLTIK
jgi:hypothetical protein